tara:strand:- start:569 stop:1399 length:831 start_codon:yes stop_codon:yes gene_type:complete
MAAIHDEIERLPRLGFGLWQVPEETASLLVEQAISTGYRLVDTAEAYYNEVGVGEGLRRSEIARDELVIQSKVWNTHHGFSRTLQAFDDSMDRLGLEKLDLYLMHWPSQAQDKFVETWKAMLRLRDDGRVKKVGVCNFAIPQLVRLMEETGEAPFLNQVELHPYFQQKPLRAYHAKAKILTQSWSPLGIWKGRASPLANEIVQNIAHKHAKNPGQVILRWHLDEGLHLLTKSEKMERIQQNFEVLEFNLDAEDLKSLRGLDREDGRNGPDPETAIF